MTIRPIQLKDNPLVAAMIRSVLIEFNVPKVGTAYADPQLDKMFETYNQKKSMYFVIEEDDTIVGGAGIAPLENGDIDTCELQKMYFLPQARQRGLGSEMMECCIEFARKSGFQKAYLETMPYMSSAQKLYLKTGFDYLDAPMGNTGHTSCPVWMLKDLRL